MKTRIGKRLHFWKATPAPLVPTWGGSFCRCGNKRETVFFRVGHELICRNHLGHPLFSGGSGEDTTRATRFDTRTLQPGGV